MSNRAYANVNKVTNIVTNNSYFEIDIFDNHNYGSVIIEEEQIPKTDIDALKYLRDNGSYESDDVCDLIDSLLEYNNGITINDTFYEWEEIKHIFGMDEENPDN